MERTDGLASSGRTTTMPSPGLATSYSTWTTTCSHSSSRFASSFGVAGVLPASGGCTLTTLPTGRAMPSSPSSPSLVARQTERFSSGYVWMFSGCVSTGGAGGR